MLTRTTGLVDSDVLATSTSWASQSTESTLLPSRPDWSFWGARSAGAESSPRTTDATIRVPSITQATLVPSLDSRISVIGPNGARSAALTGFALSAPPSDRTTRTTFVPSRTVHTSVPGWPTVLPSSHVGRVIVLASDSPSRNGSAVGPTRSRTESGPTLLTTASCEPSNDCAPLTTLYSPVPAGPFTCSPSASESSLPPLATIPRSSAVGVISASPDCTSEGRQSFSSEEITAPSSSTRTRLLVTPASERTTWAAIFLRAVGLGSPSLVRSTSSAPSSASLVSLLMPASGPSSLNSAPRIRLDGPFTSSSVTRCGMPLAGGTTTNRGSGTRTLRSLL